MLTQLSKRGLRLMVPELFHAENAISRKFPASFPQYRKDDDPHAGFETAREITLSQVTPTQNSRSLAPIMKMLRKLHPLQSEP